MGDRATPQLAALADLIGVERADDPAAGLLARRLLAALPAARDVIVTCTEEQARAVLTLLLSALRDVEEARAAALRALAVLCEPARSMLQIQLRRVFARHDRAGFVAGVRRRLEHPDESVRLDALFDAYMELGLESEAMLLRHIDDPARSVSSFATRQIIGCPGALNDDALRRLAASHPDYVIRSAATTTLECGDDMDQLVRAAYCVGPEQRVGAPVVLQSRAEALARRGLPWLERRVFIFQDEIQIAVALWSIRPIGWDAPAWLLHHGGRSGNKLFGRVRVLALEYHRRLLLGQLRRRPSITTRRARARRQLLAVLSARRSSRCSSSTSPKA
ncbi:MAG: hypothetical protein KC468_05075 [Myxococcales bacterium]|nr:hypothetical protein [Myxococcales bacterium]